MVNPSAAPDTLMVSSSVSASAAVVRVNSLVTGGEAEVNGASAAAVMVTPVETGVKSPDSAEPPASVPSAVRDTVTTVSSVIGSAPAGRDTAAVIAAAVFSDTRGGVTARTSGAGRGSGVGAASLSRIDTAAGAER